MKKVYLFAFALMATFALNAQLIDDNFDSYTPGDIVGQAAHWALWPGGTSAQVSTAQAASGSQSMLIRNNTTDDVLLNLGDQTAGTYTIQFDMYIPSGATGFYNFQKFENVGTSGNFAGQVFVGATASGGVAGLISFTNGANIEAQIPYPSDTWFTLSHVIDLDNSTIAIYMNGSEEYSGVYGGTLSPQTELGAIDFYSIDANNEMYIDNVLFSQGNTMGTEDFSAANFSVYPNPINDVLNIRSKEAVSSITVYNLLGKTVLQAQPNTLSPSIDTGSLASGVYLVKVEIGGSSKTIKVIK